MNRLSNVIQGPPNLAAVFMDPALPGPRLTRQVNLRMMGDWGVANLHRICGWISAELWARTGTGSAFSIWNGRGGTDAIDAVLDGRVDAALFVPANFGRTMFEGRGISSRSDLGRLRALATLPQTDALVLAVDARLGITDLETLRRRRPPLRLAAAWDDGQNMTGFASHRLLEAARMPRAEIESWGGRFIEGEGPWDTIAHATRGDADAVLFEAIMTPYWKDLLATRPMNFVPIDDATLTALETKYGWPRCTVPADRFAGQDGPFEALDFSDFLFFCRDDLPADLAYLIAWCVCETRSTIESQYLHIPPQNSPLTYPLQPARMAQTSIPLHDAARQYYREQGYL